MSASGIARRAWPVIRPWLPIVLAAALLYLLVAAVKPAQLAQAMGHFNPAFIAPLIVTYFLYLGFRAWRWHLLMRPLEAPNSLLDSLLLFSGAQAALLIPGGQFLLPVLQKIQHGTLIRRSAATVIVQELIFGIIVLPAALPGAWHDKLGWLLLAAFILSVVAGTLLLVEPIGETILGLLSRLPFLHEHHLTSFRDLRGTIVCVVSTREAILGSVLDMAAVGAAGTSLYIALRSLGVDVGWPAALASFAFGNAAANVSSLPGGLGATEDTATAILAHLGVAAGPAAAATLIYRAATLILGTVVGWVVLFVCRRRFRVHQLNIKTLVAALQHGAEEAASTHEPVRPERDPAVQAIVNPHDSAA